jgi:branched-chain amino acid transport system ATP-binding protein
MSAGPTLEVQGLAAGYGDLQILSDIDLHVDPGEYVTIVGPNGAGKSTVMKSIVGLTTIMAGSIRLGETDLAPLPTEQTVHYGVGYVPQSANIFTGLSVEENLEMGAYILEEVPAERMARIFERFPILEERRKQRAGQLSGGQRQMLAMGRALMLDPAILLLDEPSAVLMVEQNAKEALRRCDRGYVLVDGQNRYMDTGAALLADESVRQEFLGG